MYLHLLVNTSCLFGVLFSLAAFLSFEHFFGFGFEDIDSVFEFVFFVFEFTDLNIKLHHCSFDFDAFLFKLVYGLYTFAIKIVLKDIVYNLLCVFMISSS